MTKKPVQKETQNSTRTREHQDTTDIQKKMCFSDFTDFYFFIYYFLNDFSIKCWVTAFNLMHVFNNLTVK